MSSKRKAPAQAPDTEKTTKTASSQPAEEKEPKTLNFDDDEVTVYTKWGSDPDALNGKSSDWEVKLVNTMNPATSVKTENVCVRAALSGLFQSLTSCLLAARRSLL